MKVLIIGSGGREHAIAWKVASSPDVTDVIVAPGNAGTASEAGVSNVDIAADDTDALLAYAKAQDIDLTIVGPEVPLVKGVVDAFVTEGLRIFGPTAGAARLEGSKAFAKDFLQRHNIPTAAYRVFDNVPDAADYIEALGAPIVIKADGLASGKGVVVAMSVRDALSAVHDMLSGDAHGDAGRTVVVEEFLQGEEASFICMVDGTSALAMATSQDHKARNNGDTGPNTGGMGAYSPAPVVTPAVQEHIMRDIINPVVNAMIQEGTPFTGFLYAGLMIDDTGNARVIEFNVRLGDPETQPLMMRLDSDLVELCNAAIDGRLDEMAPRWSSRPSVGVVMAAGSYPQSGSSGEIITGLDAPRKQDVKVFHAGTRAEGEDTVTAGGRVLCVTAVADTVAEAQADAYDAVNGIHWQDVYFRTDIAWRALSDR